MLAQLQCGYQAYDWGKLGETSKVAACAAASGACKSVDAETPYAELWMGTHPKQPSQVVGKNEDLRQLVNAHPEALGSKVIEKFGDGELPYLFKVLSIRKALSIQAHPDKALAKQLHARDPKNYPDDNHKPEMAIALTDFEGFCGFRPPAEIASFLTEVPEFRELVGPTIADAFQDAAKKPEVDRDALRELLQAVMTAPDDRVAELVSRIIKRAQADPRAFAPTYGGSDLANLLVRVDSQFPGDVGVFCGGLMLNYVRLKKGEAMFLRAKDPHAYISGDIIECMAASDNVVRAGFTPKFKDVETLVSMLTYSAAPVAEQKMVPKSFAPSHGPGKAELFDPPIDEFAVLQQSTPKGGTTTIDALTGPSIFIVTEGEGKVEANGSTLPFTSGLVFFVGAGTKLELTAESNTVSYHAVAEV